MGGMMIRRYIISLALVGLLFIIPGCGGGGGGGGDDVVAPAESTITISGAPSDTISIGTSSTSWYEYCCIVIVVKNANGIPLNDVDISISYPWAVPSPPGLVQFYDGKNNPQDSPLNVKTDINGAYYLKIGYQGGLLEYTGSILVVSGSVSAAATFAVDTGSE